MVLLYTGSDGTRARDSYLPPKSPRESAQRYVLERRRMTNGGKPKGMPAGCMLNSMPKCLCLDGDVAKKIQHLFASNYLVCIVTE